MVHIMVGDKIQTVGNAGSNQACTSYIVSMAELGTHHEEQKRQIGCGTIIWKQCQGDDPQEPSTNSGRCHGHEEIVKVVGKVKDQRRKLSVVVQVMCFVIVLKEIGVRVHETMYRRKEQVTENTHTGQIDYKTTHFMQQGDQTKRRLDNFQGKMTSIPAVSSKLPYYIHNAIHGCPNHDLRVDALDPLGKV